MNCINIKSPEFKALAASTGIPEYELDYKIAQWQDANNSLEFPSPEQLIPAVNYSLRAVKAVSENMQKMQALWNKMSDKNMFWNKIQQDYGIPKDQIVLLKESEGNTLTDKLTSFLANYSYTVEINLGTERIGTQSSRPGDPNFQLGEYFYTSVVTWDDSRRYFKLTSPDDRYSKSNEISKEEYLKAQIDFGNLYEETVRTQPTQYYSNLTVPGGTNYTENEIVTPAITPSIKGHAQFATDKGIGWFRSDDQRVEGIGPKTNPLFEQMLGMNLNKNATKTRRILEVQSDLFQKGRDKEFLDKTTGDKFKAHKEWYGDEEGFEGQQSNENQFLQLLNKDNNWVNFFVKSIIQDSAKKGYEKVLFPSGDTASKVEGHTTLEEFKKEKEDRIKELEADKLKVENLEKTVKKEDLYLEFYGEDGLERKTFNTLKELQEFSQRNSGWENEKIGVKEYGSYKVLNSTERIDNEIKTLKTELERVEKEGFGALKPIYNFYEIVVSNVLKKQGFNPKRITDEYGNTWNEVSVLDAAENIRNIYLQTQTSPEQRNAELDAKIKDFLSQIGISVQNVNQLTDFSGNPITGVALANLLDKVIQVVDGKAGIDTLPEEAGHFFVEMLPKDSHIFQAMYNSIENYAVYNEVLAEYGENPLYKNNPEKLKKEAMGKLIAQHIVSQFNTEESTANKEKLNRWWNLLWNWIKNKFQKFNREGFYKTSKQYNAFEDAATRILQGNTSMLDFSNVEEMSPIYLQTQTDAAKKVADTILEVNNRMSLDRTKVNPKTKKEGMYTIRDKTTGKVKDILNRVSDTVEKYNRYNFAERSEAEKIQDQKSKDLGTNVHNALNNIITRFVEGLNGRIVTAPQDFGLPSSTYEQLRKYAEELLKSYPAGTVFLSETMIYDEKKDEAGTIDLIVITPEGTVDLYDWKTMNLYGKDKIPFYKEEQWNIQLSRYKAILRNYGLKNFGKLRIVPISVSFDKKGDFKNLAIGGEKLEQIPMAGLRGGEFEKTGVEAIDSLIEALRARMTKVAELKIPYSDVKKKNLQIERIERFKASIKDLQLKKSYEKFLEDTVFELNLIKNTGVQNMTIDELQDAKSVLSFYSRLVEAGYLEDGKNIREQFKDLSTVVTSASIQLNRVNKEIERRAVELANSQGINNLLDPQKEAGAWKRLFRSVSQSEHPVIQSFYRLVTRQKDKIYQDSRVLYNQIEKAKNDLAAWGKLNNLEGTDIFNPFLQFKDGKWTGNLISKYSEEFWQGRKKAIAGKTQEDLNWLRRNIVFDQTRYETVKAENMKVWKTMYGDPTKDSKANDIISKKLEQFEKDFNVIKYPFTAYGNNKNFLITPSEDNYSNGYKKIQATPALRNFYDLFVNTVKENSDYLDLNLKGNFIPSMQTDMIDRLAQVGIGSVAGMREVFADAITVRSVAGYGMVDELSGELKKSIPIFYTNPLDPDKKSKDLGSVLYLFSNMASTHRHLSEIESSVNTLKDILETRSRTVLTDASGKPVENELTGKVSQYLNSSSTLEMFNNYVDYYLYGINTSGQDKTFVAQGRVAKLVGVEGKNVSTQRLFSTTLKYFSAKSLTLNILSATANGFGGQANAFMEGAKGRFYKPKDFANALKMLATKNVKAHALVEFFDIGSDETDFKKASNLSASKLSKNLTFDKFYIAQKVGDWPVENGVLLAMLQTHTLKNGKIVKKTDETEKSLLDLSEVVDDKIKIAGLSSEEYGKFRRKVKYLYTTMKGNNSNEDISNIRLSLMGQVLMQFKNWIPRMADERFGELRYTQDLDVWEEGKYRTMVKHMSGIVNGNFKDLLTGLTAYGFFGVGAGLATPSLEEAAGKKWESLSIEEKEKISKEAYVEMYKANLRSAALEIQIIVATFVLLALLKGGDDEERTPAQKWFVKLGSRVFNELNTFVNPQSFMEITGGATKAFIPVVGLVNDVYKFTGAFVQEGIAITTGDEEWQEEVKVGKSFARLFPVTNEIQRLWSDLESPESK